jgi:hypothetical protein
VRLHGWQTASANRATAQEHPPDNCRGRFIVPTADLSALKGCFPVRSILFISIIAPTADLSAIRTFHIHRMNLSICMIGPLRMFHYPVYLCNLHYRPSMEEQLSRLCCETSSLARANYREASIKASHQHVPLSTPQKEYLLLRNHLRNYNDHQARQQHQQPST